MATATRPRQKSHEELLAERSELRRMIAAAKRKCTMTMSASEMHRSTRAQRVQRIKAECFDALDQKL